MNNSNLVIYFGSRAVSAVGNLVSVAVFARLIGPADYGAYILMFAWAIVVYGFAAQWMKFAYFGIYRAADESAIIASYTRLLIASISIVTIALSLLSLLIPMSVDFILALLALFAGMTIYEAALEVSRTRHQVGAVALSMVFRAVFVLALGCAFLAIHKSAFMLALGVSAGHLLAAIPTLAMQRDLRGAPASRQAATALFKYGWPLILSFGVFAIGQTIDRFLIAQHVGNAVLGPYGVIADMMRQSYMVAGESIALALITVAKQHADEGRREASDAVMRSAFRACMTAGAFGAAFFIMFGHDLARILLGADFANPAEDIIPFFAVAFGFMMLRSFYFGQVIYFTNGTFLELLIAVVFVATSALLALVLVPPLGAVGGAIALMIAHGASCIISAVIGRKLHVLPIDMKALVGIPAIVALAIVASWLLEGALGSPAARLAVDAVLLLIALGVVVWWLDLLKLVVSGSKPAPDAS
jgi:O-antigen/teichoic acid export membrane protein